MYCKNCGGILSVNTYHCGKCGYKIDDEQRDILAKLAEVDKNPTVLEKMAYEAEDSSQTFGEELNLTSGEQDGSLEFPEASDNKYNEVEKKAALSPEGKPFRGRKLVKVVGIILMVFGGLSILGSLGEFINPENYTSTYEYGVPDWFYEFSDILMLALAGVMLASGIYGVQNCMKSEKGQMIILFSIAMLSLILMPILVGVVARNIMIITAGIVTGAFNMVLPILFWVGGVRLKGNIK